MPDWEEDNPKLRHNLAHILNEIAGAAERRESPTLEAARRWHTLIMNGLDVPCPQYIGAFRGEPGLEDTQVIIGANYGVDSHKVGEALSRFETKLQKLVKELDLLVQPDSELNADHREAIIDLCAWVHTEWVRIHPFANGNGRTARLWANSVAMRYGLPPFVRLRPRPNANYGAAGSKAMQGDWEPTAAVFRRLLNEFLDEI